MTERVRNLIAIGVIAVSTAVVVGLLIAEPPSPERRVEALADTLRCPVCQGESIADSPSGIARDLYDLIEEQVAQGLSDEQIRDYFVQTYGDQVLLDPPADGRTIWLWLLPAVALAAGIALIAARRRPEAASAAVSPEEAP